jgi:hypothetical protein
MPTISSTPEKKMMRLTTHSRLRISNRLAIFAALMLAISTLAGIGESVPGGQGMSTQIAGITSGGVDQNAGKSPGGTTPRKNKGFKMSLYLFRGN